MDVYDKALITLFGVYLLIILIAVPLVLRRVPRNAIYGFRTRATLGSDELWFSANAHFGRGLIVATLGGAFAVVGIDLLQPFSFEAFVPVSVGLMVAPSLLAALATLRYVRARQRASTHRGRA